MKGAVKSLVFIIAVGMFAAALPATAEEATGGLRYTTTVTKFENQAGWHGQWDIGDAWGTVLTDMLNQTGKFIVLGESDMRAAALDEQDFAASGRTAGGAKAPVTGQMTPAQILIKGAITHVQGDTGGADGGVRIKGFKIGGGGGKGEVNATIYMVDSTTGMVLASKSVVGTHKRKALGVGYDAGGWGAAFGGHTNDNVGLAVQDACALAVEFMVAQLPNIQWSGSVVMVKDGKVYMNLNAGRISWVGGVTSGRPQALIESKNNMAIIHLDIFVFIRVPFGNLILMGLYTRFTAESHPAYPHPTARHSLWLY